MLATRERIQLTTSLESFLREVEARFIVLPLTGMIAKRSVQFTERYPQDPMDRIIGATALIEGIPLVTKDEKIRHSKEVPSIW
jgi:PIN domain nuclease of toxin-antitoxin system